MLAIPSILSARSLKEIQLVLFELRLRGGQLEGLTKGVAYI